MPKAKPSKKPPASRQGLQPDQAVEGRSGASSSFATSQESRPGINSVIERAAEVIGDRNEAMRWLGTPVRALDYATPISLLGTSEGTARVEDLLGQIEHGLW